MKNWKRYLSIAMTLVMLLGVLPTAAFAEGEEGGEGGVMPLGETPTITLTPSEAEYTGTAIEFTVGVSGITGEYAVTCSEGVTVVDKTKVTALNPGPYTVTVTPAGGSAITKTFTINKKSVAGLTVILGSETQTYDGNQKTPNVTVKHGDTVLTKNTHYTVEYGHNINAGENAGSVKVTATADSNYTGDTVKNFTIQSLSVASEAITVTIPSITYGQTPAPVVTCKMDDSTTINLVKDTDYTVSYSGTDADTQTATITLCGNYSGSKTVDFTINSKLLDETAIQPISPQTYTGSAITPVVVKDGDKTLVAGTDYDVTYDNNTNAAAADAENAPSATVTFKGNYSGDPVTKKFTISPKDISDGSMSGLNSACNKNDRPVPTITVDGKTLVKDTDFTLVYVEGSDSLKITATGTGNYSGTLEKTLPVLETSDTTAPLITGVEDGKTYYAEQTATITDTNLDRVEVHHNGSVSTSRPADTNPTTLSVNLAFSNTPYQIKAYDKVGNVTTITVTVTKKTVTSGMITIAGADNIVYDGTAKTPAITVKDDSATIAAENYTLSWENNTNAGTATVKVTMNSDSNYQGEATKTFTIKRKTLLDSAIQDIVSQTYTGSPITPTVTVMDGTKTLEMGTNKDYTVSYTNNTNPGTAKVTVVLRGNYTGTLEKTFTIGQDLRALENNIKTLAAKTTLTYAEKQQIKQLKAAYDALSASEKATVDREVGSALMTSFKNKASAAAFKLLNKPSVDYYKYVKGTSSNVVIGIDADYSRTLVTEIRMGKNLTVIDPANYTVTEGSVVVTLSSSYLKQIKDAGKYNLYIDLMDTQTGHTETVQTVVRILPATDIPQTGDPFRMNLWIGLLGASVLALAGLGVYEVVKKKNGQKRLEAAVNLDEEPSDEANTNE